jgi:5-methylcytosine-specific restriction endonuclease McrA
MELEEIYSFLNTTADKLEDSWNIQVLSNIANQRVPDLIMNGRGSLLRADIHILWTQWFIESICNPDIFVNSNQGYAYIIQAVKQRIPEFFANFPENELNNLTKYLARLVDNEVKRRKVRKRIPVSLDTKKFLWDVYGPDRRCWICGYKFTKWAANKFLEEDDYIEQPTPQFFDYITLHGLTQRDLSVEVDHAVPLTKGGNEEDNLRLACGWCNARKGDRISLYDVAGKPYTVEHPKLGKQSIPHSFWVVRLLCVRQCCEYEGGCSRTVENAQLTVISKNPEGAMNPTNLRVICSEHDPLGSNRFISKKFAEKIRALGK